MKKHTALIFLMIGLPVMAQVQLEVDAVKPRTITQSEAAETVIARGEITVDPDTGSLFIGDGENESGYELNATNYLPSVGDVTPGGSIHLVTNTIYGLSSSFPILSFDGGGGYGGYVLGNIWEVNFGSDLHIESGFMTWDNKYLMGFEERSLHGYTGAEIINFNCDTTNQPITVAANMDLDTHYISASSFRGNSLFLSGTNALIDNGTNLLRNGVAIGSGTETDPAFTNWLAEGGSALTTNEVDPKVLASLEGHTGDYYVAKWGSDANAGTSWETPFLTLQNSLVQAGTNIVRIAVAGGEYDAVNVTNSRCTIVGLSKYLTSITGRNTGSCVKNYSTGTLVVENVSIKNGYYGAAIEAYNSAWVTVRDSVIEDCYVGTAPYVGVIGAGVGVNHCDINNCSSGPNMDKAAVMGWAAYSYINQSTIRNCSGTNAYIVMLSAVASGGYVSNCVFIGNAGNILVSTYDSSRISGCSFINNSGIVSGAVNSFYSAYGTNRLYSQTEIYGDLTQRVTDRHYFGTDYMGNDGTNFFLNHLGTSYYIQVSTNAPVY